MIATDLAEIIAGIEQLPEDWHKVGCVGPRFLRAVVRHVSGREISHSMETGSGKSTLLFSHLSRDHKVFAINDYGDIDTGSVTNVRTSPLFNSATVEFIEGPTQRTLPRYEFEHPLQLALIDGPHGYPFPDLEYYFIYPHLDEGALLIVDDIHIPTIRHIFDFLKEEEMFRLLEVVDQSAFFIRTAAPFFDPYLDGWWLQSYNKKRFPIEDGPAKSPGTLQMIKSLIPSPVKKALKRVIGRPNLIPPIVLLSALGT